MVEQCLVKVFFERFLKHGYFIHFPNHIWRVPCSISWYIIDLKTMKIFCSKEHIESRNIAGYSPNMVLKVNDVSVSAEIFLSPLGSSDIASLNKNVNVK